MVYFVNFTSVIVDLTAVACVLIHETMSQHALHLYIAAIIVYWTFRLMLIFISIITSTRI